MNVAEFKNVVKTYTSGDHVLNALDGINLSLEEGKFAVILGPSGAGKSTLLNMLGGLDSPTSGTIIVNGKDISTLNADELAEKTCFFGGKEIALEYKILEFDIFKFSAFHPVQEFDSLLIPLSDHKFPVCIAILDAADDPQHSGTRHAPEQMRETV